MKRPQKRYVGYRLAFNGSGEVLVRVRRDDLAALQTAWGWLLLEWTKANGPEGPHAAFMRAMSGTLYNHATSKQRGDVLEFRAYWRFARMLGEKSEKLMREWLIVNDPALAERIQRAIAALKDAGNANMGPRRELSDEEQAALPYRSGDSSHNSRVARARRRLADKHKFQPLRND